VERLICHPAVTPAGDDISDVMTKAAALAAGEAD